MYFFFYKKKKHQNKKYSILLLLYFTFNCIYILSNYQIINSCQMIYFLKFMCVSVFFFHIINKYKFKLLVTNKFSKK